MNQEPKLTLQESFNLFLFAITVGIGFVFFKAYVIKDIASWFLFPVELSLVQWFGICQIISLLTPKPQSYPMEKPYKSLLNKALSTAIIWGVLYLVHLTIK